MKVGVDAHKKRCVAAMFNGSSEPEMFEFRTTREGVSEFMNKVPEGSTVVIESSTTGKTLSMMLSEKYEVHMIAPPERKPQVKTDKRDAVKIVMEDELGYARRVYVPSPYIEELRTLVSRVMELRSRSLLQRTRCIRLWKGTCSSQNSMGFLTCSALRDLRSLQSSSYRRGNPGPSGCTLRS